MAKATPPSGDTLIARMVFVPVEALGRVTADTPKVEFTTLSLCREKDRA